MSSFFLKIMSSFFFYTIIMRKSFFFSFVNFGKLLKGPIERFWYLSKREHVNFFECKTIIFFRKIRHQASRYLIYFNQLIERYTQDHSPPSPSHFFCSFFYSDDVNNLEKATKSMGITWFVTKRGSC